MRALALALLFFAMPAAAQEAPTFYRMHIKVCLEQTPTDCRIFALGIRFPNPGSCIFRLNRTPFAVLAARRGTGSAIVFDSSWCDVWDDSTPLITDESIS